MAEFLNNVLFIFQRFDAQSAIDILLVTAIFFGLMFWLRDTQAMVLMRGVILIERILPRVHPTSRCERRPAFQRCRLPARPVPAI